MLFTDLETLPYSNTTAKKTEGSNYFLDTPYRDVRNNKINFTARSTAAGIRENL